MRTGFLATMTPAKCASALCRDGAEGCPRWIPLPARLSRITGPAWKTGDGRAGRRFSARRPFRPARASISPPGHPQVEAYRGRHLVADIASLADHLSAERPFVLAGHDWGASVAYAFAFSGMRRGFPNFSSSPSGVHPVCFQRAIIEDPEQRQASQYMRLLRSERAEQLLSGRDNYRRP